MPKSQSSIYYLVVINCIFFALSYLFKVSELETLALYFPLNEKFEYYQIISHMFMHGSITHILFNMYALWSFGTPLEDAWKKPKFILFYFATGIGAAGIYSAANYYQFQIIADQIIALGYNMADIQKILATNLVDNQIMNHVGKESILEFISIYNTPVVRASGAMYGILVAFAFSYPNAKLSLIFLPIPVSARYFVPVIILGDIFFGFTKYSIGNIAHLAHIGGALTALTIILCYKVYYRTQRN